MTPEEVADLVRRVREAESSAAHRGAMLAAAHRWGTGMLSPGAVLAIQQERARGRGLKELAALYGMSAATISRAARRGAR